MFIKFGEILIETDHITAFVPSTGMLKVSMLNGQEFYLKADHHLFNFFQHDAEFILNEKEIKHLRDSVQGVILEANSARLVDLTIPEQEEEAV